MTVYSSTIPLTDFTKMRPVVSAGSGTTILAKDEATNSHLGTFSSLTDAVAAAKIITGAADWGGDHPGVAVMDGGTAGSHSFTLHQIALAHAGKVDGDLNFEVPPLFDDAFSGPVTHVDPHLAALVDDIAYTPSVQPDGSISFIYTEAFGYGPGKVATPQVPGQ